MAGPNPSIKEITAETLSEWLREKKPVKVIDIRPRMDYESWHIAEAENVDSYHSLKFRQAGELADFEDPNVPVVAVCYMGNTSKMAAYYLQSKGMDTYSLIGGMNTWSLAWNEAEIPLKTSSAKVTQIRRTGKGCLSYLITSGEETLVIDASVAPQIYLDIAEKQGSKITKVIETHIHADHLTRGRVLAENAGAEYYLPETDRTQFEHLIVNDGDVIKIGESKLRAIATPGHTYETTTYLLDEEVLFSSDTIFPTGIGRPDLKADGEETVLRATALYESLRKMKEVDGRVFLAACHTDKPVAFDSAPVLSTLKEAMNGNKAYLDLALDDFVEKTSNRVPPTPPNHLQIIQLNERGVLPPGDLSVLEAGANNCAI